MSFFFVLYTDVLQHSVSQSWNKTLYNHRPLELNEDDHERVCLVPKEKVSFLLEIHMLFSNQLIDSFPTILSPYIGLHFLFLIGCEL